MVEVGMNLMGEVLGIIRTRLGAVAAHMHMHREACSLVPRVGARPPIPMPSLTSLFSPMLCYRVAAYATCSAGSAPPRAREYHNYEY